MTPIGFVIQPGESIPEDVTEMGDRDTLPDGWARWVRHDTKDAWDWAGTAKSAGKWRAAELVGGRTSSKLVDDGKSQGWAPFRVLAVREQPTEPDPVSTQLYWLVGTALGIDGLKGVYTTEEAANEAKAEDSRFDVASIYLDRPYRVFSRFDPDPAGARDADGFLRLKGTVTGENQLDPEPQPAAEAGPVDLLDLVRQYGDEVARTWGNDMSDDVTDALFARIEAEVWRLRNEPADERALRDLMVNRIRVERDEARADADDLASRLKATDRSWTELAAERDRLQDQLKHLEAEAERLTEQAAGWMEEARHQAEKRDELFAEVERLKAAASGQTDQARDGFGIPWFIHACGAAMPSLVKGIEHAGIRDGGHNCYPPCPTPGPWRPLLVATDAPQQDGPIVLTLPEVPRKGVTLVSSKGQRFVPAGAASWVAEEVEGGRCFGAGELIDLAGPLTVEMAPPVPTLAEDIATIRNAIGEEYVGDDVYPALRRIEAAIGGEAR